MTTPETRSLIDELAADSVPVTPMRKGRGIAQALAAFAVTVVIVLVLLGARDGLLQGEFSVFFVVTNLLLLLLGTACTLAVVAMASPRVGAEHDGPRWAMVMAAVIPVAGVVALAGHVGPVPYHWDEPLCVLFGLISAIVAGSVQYRWLRRGAPVSPERAGLLLGTGAGALGTVAYGLSCPFNSVVHLGLWHAAPVVIAALFGRFVLSRFLRW
ncbi:NrsF family protein [Croceicoccus sediminis]|uniref:NrsF family protein n=1 Tax=Croceicoccus sediminis TaxID=2571150 RepID=UPI001184436E|nr:DUF1109 domain-containing protein [Croceicoccus sediminis]